MHVIARLRNLPQPAPQSTCLCSHLKPVGATKQERQHLSFEHTIQSGQDSHSSSTHIMQISKAQASDVQSIFDVVNEAYQVETGNEHLAFKNVPRFLTLDEAAARLDSTWVLKNEGEQVVGVLVAEVKNDKVDIGPIAVRKSIKGQGMGKMLLKYGESLASTSVLWVVSCRSDLFPWYLRNGYVEVKRMPAEDYIPPERLTRKNLEMVCMEKAGKGTG